MPNPHSYPHPNRSPYPNSSPNPSPNPDPNQELRKEIRDGTNCLNDSVAIAKDALHQVRSG